MRLFQNIFTPFPADDAAIREHFQSKYRFVSLFNHQSDLGDPLGPRTSSASRTIICPQPKFHIATTACRQPANRPDVAANDTVSRFEPRKPSFDHAIPVGRWTYSPPSSQFRSCPITKLQILHRSISPSTMSMDPIAATTSASNPPSHIFGKVCRFARHAARICTRYGFAVPSLTM
jgi:hypothetical protein